MHSSPGFRLEPLFQRGQVQSVLCHAGTKDFWARIAHYIIPNSGPSGKRGFNDRARVSHAVLDGGRHSDFFRDDVMLGLFEQKWQLFLTRPSGEPVWTTDDLPALDWTQTWWPFRATLLRVFLVAAVTVALLAALAIVRFGLG